MRLSSPIKKLVFPHHFYLAYDVAQPTNLVAFWGGKPGQHQAVFAARRLFLWLSVTRPPETVIFALGSGSFLRGFTTMNWDQIIRNWKQVSDKIKRTWGKLSDDDLAVIAGKRDLLASLLQQRYGYEKLQAETKVDDFAKGLN